MKNFELNPIFQSVHLKLVAEDSKRSVPVCNQNQAQAT